MKRNFWMILAMVLCLLVSCALAEETAAAGAEPASEQDQTTLLAGSAENNFQMYSILAQTGDVEAAYQLGIAYYEGVVTEKDLEAAFMWFEAAADSGHMLGREWMDNGYMGTIQGVRSFSLNNAMIPGTQNTTGYSADVLGRGGGLTLHLIGGHHSGRQNLLSYTDFVGRNRAIAGIPGAGRKSQCSGQKKNYRFFHNFEY